MKPMPTNRIYSAEHIRRHYFQNAPKPWHGFFNSPDVELMDDIEHVGHFVHFIMKEKLSYLINGVFYTIYRYSTITHSIKPVSEYYEFEDYNDAKTALKKEATNGN